jgi:tryptophanyl-tRNA synthetase
MMKKRILSGMRPTGKLHLGHLAGALENWVKLQDEYECFFMLADWHALMSEYENPQLLAETILDNLLDWLSAGLDPAKATIFLQSALPQHLELYMLFSCFVPLGRLERCPTYKEQLREIKSRNLNTYGFLGYPVLQAADVLLYKAQKVPVGEDQLPHLELTREIARRFNSLYQREIFPEPEAILTASPRLSGLDGRKMSKSYNNTINLTDPPEVIEQKISRMITDPQRIRLTDKGRPQVCSVFSYYASLVPAMKEEVSDCCTKAKLGCTACKEKLSAALIERLRPLRQRRRELGRDKDVLKKILLQGRQKAMVLAEETIKQAKEAVGLYEL